MSHEGARTYFAIYCKLKLNFHAFNTNFAIIIIYISNL